MVWRTLERSDHALFLLAVMLGLCAVGGAGIVWSAVVDAQVPWDLLFGLVWLPSFLLGGISVRCIARRRFARTAAASPPREFYEGDPDTDPLPAGAQVLDFRMPEAWPFLRAAAVAGVLIGLAEPGPTSLGTVVGVTVIVTVGLGCLGLAAGLVSGKMTVNDGLIAMAFGSRSDAAFMRASVPAYAAVGVAAGLYLMHRYGVIVGDALDLAVAVAVAVLVPPMVALALVGRPRTLLPFFYRQLGGQQRLWDAIPDPPYDRKAGRTRRRERG